MGNRRMEAEMAQIIGEPIIESIYVLAKGETKTIRNIVGSQIFGTAVPGGGYFYDAVELGIKAGIDYLKGPEQVTQEHLKLYPKMMLAISSSQVAFFELKVGFISNSIGQLILQIHRSSIFTFLTCKTNSLLARGLLIQLKNNRQYVVETPLGNLLKLRRIIKVFYQTQDLFWA